MFDFDVGVVIPIAGKGERFPTNSPKQYFKLLGKPLFLFCVEEFYKFPFIKKICLVSDRVEHVQNVLEEHLLKQDKIMVVTGGATRHISIKNGLTELAKSDNFYKVVVIHDGVRPIVPEQLLIKIISGASAHGAAGVTRPLVSTVIKPNSDGCLETSLDRNAYLMSETPQAFLLQLILNAYQKCSADDLEHGTECLQLALKHCGVKAKLIPGPESLWKVTDKKDYYSVIPYMREMYTEVCLMGCEEDEVIKDLFDALKSRVHRVECLVTGSELKPNQQAFNTVVCVHDKEIDQENQLLRFGAVLDVERQGLIIHVVQHSSSDGMQSTSVYELHRNGRNMTKHYEKLKKGVVMIHYLSHGEEKRLIDLIVSLIFTDAHVFSGQTLFL